MTNTTATSEPHTGTGWQRRNVVRVPRSTKSFGQLRRFQGRRRRRLDPHAGRPEVSHRPERGWKDNVGRRHHRTRSRDGVPSRRPASNCSGKKVHKIARLGVGRTFQTASVFEELSVLQNLDIAAGAGRSAWNLLRRRKGVLPEIEEALETTGLEHLRDTPAGILAHGQKQWLEIGMLLVQNCSVLLLDEPVAGMSLEEREETGNLLRRIGGARTVVVVEHDMDFMRSFATSVTVLARWESTRRRNCGGGPSRPQGARGLPRHSRCRNRSRRRHRTDPGGLNHARTRRHPRRLRTYRSDPRRFLAGSQRRGCGSHGSQRCG